MATSGSSGWEGRGQVPNGSGGRLCGFDPMPLVGKEETTRSSRKERASNCNSKNFTCPHGSAWGLARWLGQR